MAILALLVAPPRRLLALVALLLPAAAAAQAPMASGGNTRGTALAPYIGWATGTTRDETWTYTDGAGAVVRDRVEMHLAGGFAAGLNLQFPVAGPLGLVGGAVYVDRADARFSINGGEDWIFTGSRNVLVKAGLAVNLSQGADPMTVRRLGAGLFVAPFYMFEKPQQIATIEDSPLFDSAHHYGVNFGVSGELPFARDHFAVQLALEDYLTFWDEAQLQRLPDWLHNAPVANATTVAAEATHQWVFRAGLTVRFR